VYILSALRSALRPAARIAAVTLLAPMAGALSANDVSAAQRGRPVMAQRAAPFHMAEQHAPFGHLAPPVFRPAPMQHAPAAGGGFSRPARVPAFTPPPGGGVQVVNPGLHRVNPGLPFNNPSTLRPNLPLNNPSALRPNFPLNSQGTAHEQGLPGTGLPANGLGTPSPLLATPNPVQSGSPAPSRGEGTPATGQALVSHPVVVKPLLKPPQGGFPQTRPAFPVVQRNDRFFPLHKDHKALFFHGQRRVFVSVALLGAILLGDTYWYPEGYVSADGPACTGYTAEGCQLEWRMVDFEEGGEAPQCVQYCPRATAAAPEQVATLPPPPPLMPGGECQTTIYSEPNFGGNSAPTGDSQPILSTTGWRNEIASIVVAAGTWDFFADENYGGESLRLTPGIYQNLAPEWTRHIGSFMCVEPGSPPA
jgi:hypothetical protein